MKNAFLALCCLALFAACAGCGRPDPTAPVGSSADGPVTNYPVRGVVQALRPDHLPHPEVDVLLVRLPRRAHARM